jgi:hypothetical protein
VQQLIERRDPISIIFTVQHTRRRLASAPAA